MAAIPKTYYYRLQNLEKADLNDILSQLTKFQNYDKAQLELAKINADSTNNVINMIVISLLM